MAKVDTPEFRGSTRRCPSCEGNPIVSFFTRRKFCETCFGTGVVHLGMMCKFCGRSVQYEYKGTLICGSISCEKLVKKSLNKPIEVKADNYDNSAEYWKEMYGL